MNGDNELILLNFYMLLESLEVYIEKTGHFPNFTRQLRNFTIPKEVEKRSSVDNADRLFKTKLMLFLAIVGNDGAFDEVREQVQTKYYQWINSTGITAEAITDQKLKHFFLEIMDIIEKSSEKIYNETKEYLYRKKKEGPIKPEKYSKLFGEVGNIMQNPPQLSSVDIKGDAETGKEIFQQITNSISDSDRQNFRFYPLLTDEERKDFEQKNKQDKEEKNDPMLEGLKINAIAEITASLKESKLTNSDLERANQNWENEINQGEKIMEIEKIKWRVLTDIERKKHQQIANSSNNNKFPINWIIGGVVIMAIIILGVLIIYEKKKKWQ